MATTTDLDAAMESARKAGNGGPLDGFLERIAERVGAQASVKAVFGEPIERDGITVIPVARVRWGFGGGAGSGPAAVGLGADGERAPGTSSGNGSEPGSGQGGGGGVTADPVGWLEIGPDGATFNPIVAATPSPGLILAVGATAAIVLRAFTRLVRH